MRGNLNYKGSKSTLYRKITENAGKCLCTRTLIIKGKTVYFPVYEKGGNGAAADYAMGYVAGSITVSPNGNPPHKLLLPL